MKQPLNSNIRLVARRAGVSPTTVSRVLNNNPIPSTGTREKVWQAVADLNYQPDPAFSQALKLRRQTVRTAPVGTRTIGFFTNTFIRDRAQRDDGYYSRVLAGIQAAAQEQEYHLMIEAAPPGERGIPAMVKDNRVDGLLIEGRFPEAIRRHLSQRFPVVFVDNNYPGEQAGSVMPNIEAAVTEQVQYLWDLGHRQIITFQPPAEHPVQQRLHWRGFQDFFLIRNLPIPAPKLCTPRAITPETHVQVMAEYARQVAAARPRPTAIVTWDIYALSLMAELQQLGLRVPEEISLIGMDDTMEARLATPQLTSTRFPMDHMGRAATELLLQQLRDRSRPVTHLLINGQLIERGSCAAVGKGTKAG